MRDTTFFWLRGTDGTLRGMSTPWGMMRTATGPGEAGSEARRGIVERYRGNVFALARGISRSDDTANEIVQEFAVEFLEARIYAKLSHTPRPTGPLRLLAGTEYETPRATSNAVNAWVRALPEGG